MIPIVLAGGTGTRLWPLSRLLHPKQLLSLHGPRTLLQETVQRVRAEPIVLCDEGLRFLVGDQLRSAGVNARVVLEPDARGTAPAVVAAALLALADGDPLLVVLPTDHVIEDPAALAAALEAGRVDAEAGAIVAYGVPARSPDPQLGYLRPGAPTASGARAIAELDPKPTLVAARYYVEQGWSWNTGITLFRASALLAEVERQSPALLASVRRSIDGATRDLDFLRLDPRSWHEVPSLAIDAIVQRAANAVLRPLDGGWTDINSWAALHASASPDPDGNVLRGDVLATDTTGSYVHATHRLVATVGVRDHVVIETADAVLVAPRDGAEEIGSVVARLQALGREEASLHRRVARPWGTYEGVDRGPRFQVKRIRVNPGASLSLQLHHQRAEHWIVVKGTARVTRGEEVFLLTENESTFIPVGTKHRLANPGAEPLEIIEVQTGSYLGEDDIVRFDDVYGR